MTRWRASVVITVVLAVGCDDAESPPGLTPTPLIWFRPLALQPGPHWLHLIGFAHSTDPLYPPCEDFFLSHGGMAIRTAFEIAKEGDTWVGRSPAGSGGDLEFRFREIGARVGGVDIAGGMRGSAADMPTPPLYQSTGVRAWVQGTTGRWAAVEGLGEFGASFLRGRITGNIRFGDGERPGRCTAVMWSLVPDTSVRPNPPAPRLTTRRAAASARRLEHWPVRTTRVSSIAPTSVGPVAPTSVNCDLTDKRLY